MKITDSHCVSIETTYYGQTTHRGARIKASAGELRTIWVSYYTDTGEDTHHDRAALALMDKMGWDNDLLKGSTETGYIYLMQPVVKRVRDTGATK